LKNKRFIARVRRPRLLAASTRRRQCAGQGPPSRHEDWASRKRSAPRPSQCLPVAPRWRSCLFSGPWSRELPTPSTVRALILHDAHKAVYRHCIGRAPVPSHQAPVRAGEGSLPWVGQEHGTRDHVVCAVESVDGATTADGNGSSPPAKRMRDAKRGRCRSTQHRASPLAPVRLLAAPIELAFPCYSDLP
jgi:hypothetical protein